MLRRNKKNYGVVYIKKIINMILGLERGYFKLG
jgi:hypothetical protein